MVVTLSPPLLLCPSKMETKIFFPLLELFNSVFKALNLFLSKYVAEIQLPGNDIRLLSIAQSSVMAWHW